MLQLAVFNLRPIVQRNENATVIEEKTENTGNLAGHFVTEYGTLMTLMRDLKIGDAIFSDQTMPFFLGQKSIPSHRSFTCICIHPSNIIYLYLIVIIRISWTVFSLLSDPIYSPLNFVPVDHPFRSSCFILPCDLCVNGCFPRRPLALDSSIVLLLLLLLAAKDMDFNGIRLCRGALK